jgi:cytochrome P450
MSLGQIALALEEHGCQQCWQSHWWGTSNNRLKRADSLYEITLYLCITAFYRIWFHPLSKFPGPKSAAICNVPLAWVLGTGRILEWTRGLHDKHGEIVRTGPNTLSFTSHTAWKDIYGHRQGHRGFQKNITLEPINGVHSIVSTPSDPDHSRMRRLLSHAFSEKALREQEPLLQSYIDVLIHKLREQTGPVNLVKWFNFTTFDIIGKLSFGESFNCLEETQYHPWVTAVFDGIKAGIIAGQVKRLIPSDRLLKLVIPPSMKARRRQNFDHSKEKVARRLELGPGVTPDFMSYILRYNDEKGMTRGEIDSTGAVLFAAGSETTATLLSGLSYHLLKNPTVMKKVVDEIRGAFQVEEDIKILSVGQLPYLSAVLEEALRTYPPAPSAFERIVPEGGDEICGHWIPGGVS